jgi:DNA-binding transcriptional LysR family regulator
MVVFARVVQQRSFSSAARDLGSSTSAVSKRIARLEERTGARLLARTTRHVTPTEAGLLLYERCLRILREVEDAELMVEGLARAPRGLLRVSAPVYFGHVYVAPLLAALVRAQPELRVELSLSDRFVDLVAEGFDLAVRVGAAPVASLVARRLARIPYVACASPAYLERRGRPLVPKDLLDHECLRYTLASTPHAWRFKARGGEESLIPITGSFSSNHSGALREAAIAGVGVVYLPRFYVVEALESGELTSVLEAYSNVELAVSAVYPQAPLVPPKTRACFDWLARDLPVALAARGRAAR